MHTMTIALSHPSLPELMQVGNQQDNLTYSGRDLQLFISPFDKKQGASVENGKISPVSSDNY